MITQGRLGKSGANVDAAGDFGPSGILEAEVKELMGIYVTGDIHGGIDIAKLGDSRLDDIGLSKEDYLIICGDFGCQFHGGDERDEYWLSWLERRPFTTLFIDGNHENHAALSALPVERWRGGAIHRLRPSIIHLMRGQVFVVDGNTLFCMGGAASIDRLQRVEGESWWPGELPDEEEYAEAMQNLERARWNVDYVFTHCAPTKLVSKLRRGRVADEDYNALTDFLQGEIEGRLEYKTWYFGHYHEDWWVDRKHRAIFNNIVELDGSMVTTGLH